MSVELEKLADEAMHRMGQTYGHLNRKSVLIGCLQLVKQRAQAGRLVDEPTTEQLRRWVYHLESVLIGRATTIEDRDDLDALRTHLRGLLKERDRLDRKPEEKA